MLSKKHVGHYSLTRTLYTSKYCPRGTAFPSEYYPGGHYSRGTIFTLTPLTITCLASSPISQLWCHPFQYLVHQFNESVMSSRSRGSKASSQASTGTTSKSHPASHQLTLSDTRFKSKFIKKLHLRSVQKYNLNNLLLPNDTQSEGKKAVEEWLTSSLGDQLDSCEVLCESKQYHEFVVNGLQPFTSSLNIKPDVGVLLTANRDLVMIIEVHSQTYEKTGKDCG